MRGRIVITGANSAIGQTVIERALQRPELQVVAGVRSERAQASLPEIPADRGGAVLLDYANAATVVKSCAGATALVHLPGLLVETAQSTYELANVRTTRVAVDAAREAGVEKFVLVSSCGADPRSTNRFLASKGRAERIVVDSGISYTIVRCPLVLACSSLGDQALARDASRTWCALLGGGSHLEQPLDARDLADAVLNAATPDRVCNRTLDLAGPECLSARDLLRRAAELRGRRVRVIPFPLRLARWLARTRMRLSGPAGITPDVIDVLTAGLCFDVEAVSTELGVVLTPLEDTLRRSLAGNQA